MKETYGNFLLLAQDPTIESLTINFSPSCTPLKLRWRNSGLSADFLADYVTTFMPRDEERPEKLAHRDAIKGAVQYIANELLENAMKYGDEESAEPITIQLRLEADRIIFTETNACSPPQAERFRAIVGEINTRDPGEMLLEQLERAVEGDQSGLGFLTMCTDYEARLAWSFERLPAGLTRVMTQVCLPI